LDRFLASVERRAFVAARMAVGNDDDALDIVQDAMMKLAEKYSEREPAEWPPLFQRILQSRIRDFYRRAKVRNRFRTWFGFGNTEEQNKSDPFDEIKDPGAREPIEHLDAKQELASLEVAIAALPQRQQQAFMLRTWDGLDVEQTARAMGCSAGSVKTHYSRAMQALRKRAEETV
jgi:RNA polymerase sigma-70 factor (ECF subfamily)